MDIYNWKTIKEIDGAFRNYRKDPQEIKASLVHHKHGSQKVIMGEKWVITGP